MRTNRSFPFFLKWLEDLTSNFESPSVDYNPSGNRGMVAVWSIVVIMIGIYLISQLFPVYHHPDHFYYLHFSKQYLPAKDGSSVLWYDVFRLTSHHLSIGILLPVSLTLSGLFLLGYWVIKECHQRLIPTRDIIILLATLLSLGCWYFVSGRVYSDFPPTIFNFSLALLALQKAQSKKPNTIWWPIHFILLGLTITWKTHNIFLVGPTLVLTTSLFITSSPRSWYRSLCVAGLFVVLGLLVGFYQFFNQPIQTLMGIRGYSDQVDFDYLRWLYVWTPQPFFHRQIMDHVFLPSFTLSALPFPFLMTLFWVTFQLYRPIFWLSGCTLLAFSTFILCLIPGYTWHAFPISIGLYTCLVFSIFLSRNTTHPRIIMTHIKVGTLASALVVFGWYVPHEIAIQMGIKQAIGRLKTHRNQLHDIVSTIQNNHPSVQIAMPPFRFMANQNHPLQDVDSTWKNTQINEEFYRHYLGHSKESGFILITPSFNTPFSHISTAPSFWKQYTKTLLQYYFFNAKRTKDDYQCIVLFQNQDVMVRHYVPKASLGLLSVTHYQPCHQE